MGKFAMEFCLLVKRLDGISNRNAGFKCLWTLFNQVRPSNGNWLNFGVVGHSQLTGGQGSKCTCSFRWKKNCTASIWYSGLESSHISLSHLTEIGA